jgi:hypothetical protein
MTREAVRAWSSTIGMEPGAGSGASMVHGIREAVKKLWGVLDWIPS